MHTRDQYLWNMAFSALFIILTAAATWALWRYATPPVGISVFDLTLISLATFRLTRLFVYDHITTFLRDFLSDKRIAADGSPTFEKPHRGVRRTLADLFGCPWCFGTWAALIVTFFYFLTPYAWFPIAVLAVAGIGSLIQLVANLIGHSAELKKAQVVHEKADDTYTR